MVQSSFTEIASRILTIGFGIKTMKYCSTGALGFFTDLQDLCKRFSLLRVIRELVDSLQVGLASC